MKYFIVDDDNTILDILSMLVEQNGGEVVGCATNGADALEDLPLTAPDIVLVDLLMPRMDGITFVQKAKQLYPHIQFVMLSQVADKEMVGRAYESGIEFFIQKPVNGIEVKKVLQTVESSLALRGTFAQMQSLLGKGAPLMGEHMPTGTAIGQEPTPPCEDRVDTILQSLGVGADASVKEIKQIVSFLLSHPGQDFTVAELCSHFSENPKTVEQRIRRTAGAGLVNLASRGIEDYADEIFTSYSGTLYKFEQVRKEMEFLRSGDGPEGKASVKQFLYALASFCSGE